MDWPHHIRKLLDRITSLRKEHFPQTGKFVRQAGIDQKNHRIIETIAKDIMLSTFLKICRAMGIKIWLDTPWGFYTLLNPDTEEPGHPPAKPPTPPEKKKKKRRKELKDEFDGF